MTTNTEDEMKVQVTVTIPDGYELADTEMRPPKSGELYLQGDEAIQSMFDWHDKSFVILRPIAKVAVMLDRKDAEFFLNVSGSHSWAHLSAACREALKAEQGT